MTSVLGTILDPAADKTVMTTLTLTLAYKGMIPCEYPHSRSEHELIAVSPARGHNIRAGRPP